MNDIKEKMVKLLPGNIKDNEEIVFARYKKLKEDAEYQHKDEVEHELISPYRRS